MINQAREIFCQGKFPSSLIYVLIVEPVGCVPSTFMPLPSRSTSAGPPVVLDTALLPRYKEVVTDLETGNVIHHCDERLSQHTDHGRAKKKSGTNP